MAFNLTANINARLAQGAGASIAKDIKSKLSGIYIPVDIKLSAKAEKNAQKLATSVKGLNAQLELLGKNATSASSAIDFLSRSMGNFRSGAVQLNKTAQSADKLKKSAKEATDQIAEFGKVAGLSLRRNAGFLLATTAVYGLGRAITSSFVEAVRFEKELVKVAQVSNRSVASLKPLSDEITRLATGLGVASGDLVDISLILAQAGLSANETRQALEALAKTTLAATFGNIADTTEGAIALMAQFKISAKDLGKALGSVNSVSAAFAVESEDIIAAVKRAGGVFAQTSKGVTSSLDAFNQFIAVFSAVRATTRESAESIATGIRTIFTRVQRPATIQYLKELGIELTDLNGRFVGPFEAVNRLSKGLEGLDRRGSTFARVAEELGGFRQIGKTLALLSSSTQRIQAYQIAQQGQASIDRDSEQAQQSLANAIAKTQEKFTALIREISQTATFDAMVRTVLTLANALIKLADAVKPIIPLLGALALIKSISIGASFATNFKQGLTGKIGSAQKLAVGGKVSGGKGGVDDIPAMLTAGEYVINKKSASKIGRKNLDELNRVGYATGGPVSAVGLAAGGDPRDELEQLRKLDRELGKGQGARKERAKLLNSIRQKSVRNQTSDPALAGLFGGGITPRFEATIGGNSISGNSGQNLAGELSEAKIQKRLADENRKRLEKNKRFNANEARLQQVELAAKQQAADAAAATARLSDLTATNLKQNVKVTRQGLPQFAGTGGLAGRQGQQTIDPSIAALRQYQSYPSRRQVRVTGSRTTSVRDYMRVLNGPYPRPELSELGAEDFGMSTSTYNPGSTNNYRSRLLRLGQRTGLLGRTRGAFGTAGRRLNGALRNISGAGVGAGILAGEQIGGTAGSTISGAAAGAGAGALVAGPWGAAIGGVVGALNGFVQARLDDKIKRASNDMIKSIDNVEEAFSKFNPSSGNIEKELPKLNKSFEDLGRRAGNVAKADFSQEAPSFISKFGLLGEAAFDRNKTFGDITREKSNLSLDTVLGNTQSNLGTSTQNAEQLLGVLIGKGDTFDQALNKLSSDAKVALAVGNVKTDTKEGRELSKALVQGDSKTLKVVADEQLRGNSILKEKYEAEARANKIMAEAARAMSQVNRQTDLFADRLINLSAVIDRASIAGEGFQRQNEAILSRRNGGAGISSQVRTNVFDNIKGFTGTEVANEAIGINRFLGDNKNSREFANSIVGAKQVESGLPRVLNELASKASLNGGAETSVLVPKLIKDNFGALPEVLQKKLASDINSQYFANEQASPDDIAQTLSSGDASQATDKITKDILGVSKKLVDSLNKAISDYESVINTFIQLNEEANRAEDNRLQILNESNNQEIQILGRRRLSVGERSAGFSAQLGQFTNRAGSGSSVSDIIAKESLANNQRAFVNGAPDEVARQLASLSVQQQNSLKALELIAGNTDRQVALTEELNSLVDSRRAFRQVAEDFAFGNPQERRQIERQVTLGKVFAEGGNILPSQRQDARAGFGLFSTIVGATQGPDAAQALDRQAVANLDRTDASRLFGLAGVNPGVGVGGLLNNEDQLFQGQFKQLQDLNRQRGAAAAGIEGINRRDANQVMQNGQASYDSFQGGLQNMTANGGLLDRLNSTLENIPTEININGRMTFDINIQGGEVLQSALGPHLTQLVQQEIAKVIPVDGASSRPGGTSASPMGKKV